MNPYTFAVAGDWHGDIQIARHTVRVLGRLGIKTLFHVGDLAVRWPGREKGKFDRRLEHELASAGVQFLFADGNHDNHKELRGLPLQADGTRRLSDHVSYIPRGTVLEVGELRIGALGGAYSVDRKWRTEGKDLWADLEEPTALEAELLISRGPIDVLICHDVPAGVTGLRHDLKLPREIDFASRRTRDLLQHVVESMRPRLAFAGHWHQRHTEVLGWPDGTSTIVHVLPHETYWGSNSAIVSSHDDGLIVVEPLPRKL
ncbi:metallophosphoesterase [Sinomonas atrocyanea]|uniref:metallophosphoesterase family protein n=1 Tax=Sinomonas atrocyanea TaxID=37927 RepID=UPI0027869697|nr:metallophosphoesterase [Sinomonas atrocyanea]MDQ0259548.1 putative phosphodiesterase [Sinomonas atrocyanea]MDR6623193.1 putative phosphodiesterase [Sinomonas atrocyanea]